MIKSIQINGYTNKISGSAEALPLFIFRAGNTFTQQNRFPKKFDQKQDIWKRWKHGGVTDTALHYHCRKHGSRTAEALEARRRN